MLDTLHKKSSPSLSSLVSPNRSMEFFPNVNSSLPLSSLVSLHWSMELFCKVSLLLWNLSLWHTTKWMLQQYQMLTWHDYPIELQIDPLVENQWFLSHFSFYGIHAYDKQSKVYLCNRTVWYIWLWYMNWQWKGFTSQEWGLMALGLPGIYSLSASSSAYDSGKPTSESQQNYYYKMERAVHKSRHIW